MKLHDETYKMKPVNYKTYLSTKNVIALKVDNGLYNHQNYSQGCIR